MPEIAQCSAELAELIKAGVSQMLEDYTPGEVANLATSEEARGDFAEEILTCIEEMPRNSHIRQFLRRRISRHRSVQLSALREAVTHLVTEAFGAVSQSSDREPLLISA